jgi:flavodoxin I
MLGAKLTERGAVLVGRWNDGKYEFAESKAFIDGKFMGLALDEVQQAEHTDRRINQWVAQIIAEFALQPVVQTEG